MDAPLPPLSLYLHLPWCVRKCPYCDFNSHRAGESADFRRYAEAVSADVRREGERAGNRTVESIFIGGGTPSLFSPELIGDILDVCSKTFSTAPNCEVTLEANPGTVEHGKLSAYRDAGVNRLSLGAQSFDPGMLEVLGRIHGPDDIGAVYREAEAAGFDSINVDIMFALPGQDVALAMADLDAAISLGPSHVSWYQLTLEPNTVFHQRPPAGIPDDSLAWDIQETGQEKLATAGYAQYEISAYAREGHRCHHNLNYWQFGDYMAAGAGAHGKMTVAGSGIYRYRKPANPQAYMEFIEQGGEAGRDPLADKDLPFEYLLNALRLNEGFELSAFAARTGQPVSSISAALDAAEADGLLEEFGDDRWRPTRRGFQFLNDLQARFLPA